MNQISCNSDNKSLVSFSNILLIFAAFPFITILPLGTDTQPYTLLVSIVVSTFLMLFVYRLPKHIWSLFFVFVFSLILLIPSKITMESVRSVANYASIFIISLAVYELTKYNGFLNKKIIYIIIFIWGGVGLIQLLTGIQIGTQFVSRTTAFRGGGRGVLSLAPEPTHYAIICLLLFILVRIGGIVGKLDKNDVTRMSWILFFQIFLLAQSSLVVLIIFVWQVFKFITKGNLIRGIWVILSLFGVYFLVRIIVLNVPFGSLSRLMIVFRLIIRQPFLFFKFDASANDRISHIFFSFKGFFENFGIPHGFNNFASYLQSTLISYRDIFYRVSVGNRIMSGYGAVLFELGIIGLIIPINIHIIINKVLDKYKKSEEKHLLFLIHLLLLMALPIATPLVGVIFGFALYHSNIKTSKVKNN